MPLPPFVVAQWVQTHALRHDALAWISSHPDEGDEHPIPHALDELRRTVAGLRPDGNPLRD